MAKKTYRKRAGLAVTAVQLKLDTEGFEYRKWGARQRCKRGDWIVNNGGEIYTIDADAFAKTYREVSPGRYAKAATVWAEIADADGSISTKEGATDYVAGDYLVYNDADKKDGYAMSSEKFFEMYEPTD